MSDRREVGLKKRGGAASQEILPTSSLVWIVECTWGIKERKKKVRMGLFTSAVKVRKLCEDERSVCPMQKIWGKYYTVVVSHFLQFVVKFAAQ